MPRRLKGELKRRKDELQKQVEEAMKDDSNNAPSVNVRRPGSNQNQPHDLTKSREKKSP
jgi:hypothetical protein